MGNIKRPYDRGSTKSDADGKWAPSLGNVAGILTPDQDAVNFSTIELTRGALEVPPFFPFWAGGLSQTPWVPTEPSFSRARENWKKLQTTRKRPTTQPTSFQAVALNYIRVVLVGYLASAWANFGGHFGPIVTHRGHFIHIGHRKRNGRNGI